MCSLRYVLRSLGRSPGFVTVTVASLGVSLGLTSTTFAILDAVVHPQVPYEHPDRVFRVHQDGDGASGEVTWFNKYLELRDHTGIHDGIALMELEWSQLQGPDGALNAYAVRVSEDFFDILGVTPIGGRLFRSGVNDATEQSGVVVSERLWRRYLGEREIEGISIALENRIYQVIGVAPEGMRLPARQADAWILLPPGVKQTGAGMGLVFPFLRLKPGVTQDKAREALGRAAVRLRDRFGTGRSEFAYHLTSVVPDPLEFKRYHTAMAGAVLAVLLIACGNLVNLMLARGVGRRRDVALQMALGASRAAVISQVLLEVALLTVSGGIVGALFSVWGIEILVHRLPPDVTHVGTSMPHLSWRVFACGLLATVAAMALSGTLPAVAAASVDASEPLKDSAATTTGRTRRSYNPLVIAAVAGAVVLLMGAGLLFKAALKVGQYDFGYDPRGLMTASLQLPGDQADSGRTHAMVTRLLERIRTVEGVESAAWVSGGIPGGFAVTSDFGRRTLSLRSYYAVSSGFLRTIGIPLIAGRDFQAGDAAGEGAVIVDERAASKLWPNVDPVGRSIKLGGDHAPEIWLPVVGVARLATLSFRADPELPPDLPIYVVPPSYASQRPSFLARVRDNEGRAAVALGRALQDAVPGASQPWVQPRLGRFYEAIAARKFMAGLFGLFGLFALSLSSIGLYGVLSYAVSRRLREFGVRTALGAQRRDVLRLVLREGAVMILAGTGIGAILAMWSAQLLSHWLYGVNPTDSVSLVAAELVLIAVSFGACLIPASRATRADPVEVLRAT